LLPLLYSGSCRGWHRQKWREGSGSELWLCCVLVNKNEDSTVSITNTGCFRCDN
jgi:hypothetical protein